MNDNDGTARGLSFSGCRCCGQHFDDAGLVLGELPICNRFATASTAAERYPLALDQCRQCGLVQLRQLPPVAAIVPQVPWISYREPEAHLDATVEALIGRHLPAARAAIGVGPFEGPWLQRLAARGVATATIDVRPGPPRAGSHPYLETWQSGLTPARLKEAGGAARADIVSCRYLVEHCHDPVAALRGLGGLLAPGGMLLVEVPDSSQFIAARDYCFLWEEHVSYFTAPTFRRLATQAGFEVVELLRYEGRLEDALVFLLRPAVVAAAAFGADEAETAAFGRYRAGFAVGRAAVAATVAALSEGPSGGIALFGMGHQAIMFANIMGFAGRITAGVDDDANKGGQFPPGFGVPVTTSAQLLDDPAIGTCLLAVNPAVEHKIRDKLAPLAARGVRFHSIFAGVPGSLLSDLAQWR